MSNIGWNFILIAILYAQLSRPKPFFDAPFEKVNVSVAEPYFMPNPAHAQAIPEPEHNAAPLHPTGKTKVSFSAFRRQFSLILGDANLRTVCSSTPVVVEYHNRTENYCMADFDLRYVVGKMIEDDNAYVHGTVSKDGRFQGVVHLKSESYYVEKSSKFELGEMSENSIVYTASAVKVAKKEKLEKARKGAHNCGLKRPRDEGKAVLKKRKRETKFPESSTCALTAIADVNLYTDFCENDVETCLEELVWHIAESDYIFRASDFSGDGTSDDNGLSLKEIIIYTSKDSPNYPSEAKKNYHGDDDSINYIVDLTGEIRSSCAVVWFNFYDFSPTLGIAYIGGVCDPDGYNQGMVSLLDDDDARLPRVVSSVTVAHEIGHLWGADHDPNGICSPTGAAGSYLMYPYAPTGTEPNNRIFSICSLRDISLNIEWIIDEDLMCFDTPHYEGSHNDPNTTVDEGGNCGDGILDFGEECDCGSSSFCLVRDKCCFPPNSDKPCKLRENAVCSTRDKCCDSNGCAVSGGNVSCHDEDECSFGSYCSGTSSKCPTPNSKPDGTPCSDSSRICILGECELSICESLNLIECECDTTSSTDAYRDACKLCCREPGGRCLRATNFGLSQPNSKIASLYVKDGSLCIDNTGICKTVASSHTPSGKVELWCMKLWKSGNADDSLDGRQEVVSVASRLSCVSVLFAFVLPRLWLLE